MGRYLVIPCEPSAYSGDLRPITDNGQYWTQEVVADNAGKARMRVWRSICEYWPDFPLGHIRVKSLNKQKAEPMVPGWEARLETANAVIRVIAKYGRRFLSSNSDKRTPDPDPFIAHFKVDANGELWFTDRYSRKDILVRLDDHWPGFSDGGTLRDLVKRLAAYITKAEPINPAWFSGTYWGYGEDIDKVRQDVCELLAACDEKGPR